MSPAKVTQGCAVAHIRNTCSKNTCAAAQWELIPPSVSLLCLSLSGVRVKIKEPPCSAKDLDLLSSLCLSLLLGYSKKKRDEADVCWCSSFIFKLLREFKSSYLYCYLCVQPISIILGEPHDFPYLQLQQCVRLVEFFSHQKMKCVSIPCLQRVSLASACPQQGQLTEHAAFSRLEIQALLAYIVCGLNNDCTELITREHSVSLLLMKGLEYVSKSHQWKSSHCRTMRDFSELMQYNCTNMRYERE